MRRKFWPSSSNSSHGDCKEVRCTVADKSSVTSWRWCWTPPGSKRVSSNNRQEFKFLDSITPRCALLGPWRFAPLLLLLDSAGLVDHVFCLKLSIHVSDSLWPHIPSRSLRSADQLFLIAPKSRLKYRDDCRPQTLKWFASECQNDENLGLVLKIFAITSVSYDNIAPTIVLTSMGTVTIMLFSLTGLLTSQQISDITTLKKVSHIIYFYYLLLFNYTFNFAPAEQARNSWTVFQFLTNLF